MKKNEVNKENINRGNLRENINDSSGVYYSAKTWPNIMLGKILLKRDGKKGENAYFPPQFVNSIHFFLPKKIGQKYNSRRGGGICIKTFKIQLYTPVTLSLTSVCALL